MKKIIVLSSLVLSLVVASFGQAQPYPPTITQSSVMQSFSIGKDGRFRLRGGYGYFFNADKGFIRLMRDGELAAEYKFRTSPYTPPLFEYEGLEIVKGKNSTLGHSIQKPGSYSLDFYMKDKMFFSYPFMVSIKTGGDAYAPTKTITADGDWNDYVFLYNNPKRSKRLTFNVFLRSDNGDYQPTKALLEIKNSTGKVVAFRQSRLRRDPWWKKFELILDASGRKNAKGEYFDTREWEQGKNSFADGNYKAELKLDGKTYGTYTFSVKGGKYVRTGRQVRGEDLTRFIEGGRNQFWMKRN